MSPDSLPLLQVEMLEVALKTTGSRNTPGQACQDVASEQTAGEIASTHDVEEIVRLIKLGFQMVVKHPAPSEALP